MQFQYTGIVSKPHKYISDGRGRDYYITYNSGGIFKDAKNLEGSKNTGFVNRKIFFPKR